MPPICTTWGFERGKETIIEFCIGNEQESAHPTQKNGGGGGEVVYLCQVLSRNFVAGWTKL